MELAALEPLKKSPYTYNGRNVVTTLEPSFLDKSSTLFQVTKIESEYDQEIPQSQTADNPVASRG